jgi:quercetin dioxygenase-like cupin family protein
MEHPKLTNEEMQKRVVRFKDIKKRPIPVMFIDSVLPRHYRVNYAVIGDTASENPDIKPSFTGEHKFQIGLFTAQPKCGPAWHTHDYIELFMPLTGKWKFYWGDNADGTVEGSAVLETWDMISCPPGKWRAFENVGKEEALMFAVLEPHEQFKSKDPYWGTQVLEEAAAMGFRADESGKMIKPANFKEVEKELFDKLVRKKKAAPAKKSTKKKIAKRK